MLAKNAVIPGTVSSGLGMGLGDDLAQQVEAQILARRKPINAVANQAPVAYGQQGLGVTMQPGGGGLSLPIQALLGQGGFNG